MYYSYSTWPVSFSVRAMGCVKLYPSSPINPNDDPWPAIFHNAGLDHRVGFFFLCICPTSHLGIRFTSIFMSRFILELRAFHDQSSPTVEGLTTIPLTIPPSLFVSIDSPPFGKEDDLQEPHEAHVSQSLLGSEA